MSSTTLILIRNGKITPLGASPSRIPMLEIIDLDARDRGESTWRRQIPLRNLDDEERENLIDSL